MDKGQNHGFGLNECELSVSTHFLCTILAFHKSHSILQAWNMDLKEEKKKTTQGVLPTVCACSYVSLHNSFMSSPCYKANLYDVVS